MRWPDGGLNKVCNGVKHHITVFRWTCEGEKLMGGGESRFSNFKL
jgi:hypothetical protein